MKRQISILACLLMLLAVVFAVASCTQPEAAHVHEYVETVTKEATCTDKGEVTLTCSCGDKYTNETAAKGHNLVTLKAEEPTCVSAGKTEGQQCADCGLVTVAQSTVAPKGHKLGAAATCTTAQTCEYGCGQVFVEALGHNAPAPTCTEDSVCKRCGEKQKDALGHKPINDATCTEASICGVCDEVVVEALGHTYPADCYAGVCQVCWAADSYVEGNGAHEYDYLCSTMCNKCCEFTNMEAQCNMIEVEAKASTCTVNGNVKYFYCEYCGYCEDENGYFTNMMSVKLPLAEHEYFTACDPVCMNCYELTNPDAAHTIKHVDAVAPTCTEMGNTEYWQCTDCGLCWDNAELTGFQFPMFRTIVGATGHSYEFDCDKYCDVCGELTREDAEHLPDYVDAVAPTCTKTGCIEHDVCEYCGMIWDADGNVVNTAVVPALGHTYPVACDPVCTVCYAINTEAAHNIVHAEVKAETCTEDGYTVEHWFCSYCDVHWIDEDCTIITSKSTVVIPAHGYGYENDRKCDECGLYVLPEAGEAFKLYMYQASLKQTLYFKGTMSGYYGATTTDYYYAPDVFIEEANGGFYMYFMSGTTKKYISVQPSGTYNNFTLDANKKGLWTFDTKTGAFITKSGSNEMYIGTYGTYNTVSASKTSFITGSNAANVDKSQFILRPVMPAEHECVYTCASAKCAICGKNGTKLPHTPGAEATCTAAQLCTECGSTITAKLPHDYVDGICSVCGAEEPTGLVNATLTFAAGNRISYSSTQQVWSANGITLTNDKASSSSNVGNYTNPIRLYQGSKVTVEGKGMTKVVITRNTGSKATAANIQSYIKSANSGATVTVSGNTITVVFATPVESFTFSCGAQVRLDKIVVNP